MTVEGDDRRDLPSPPTTPATSDEEGSLGPWCLQLNLQYTPRTRVYYTLTQSPVMFLHVMMHEIDIHQQMNNQ